MAERNYDLTKGGVKFDQDKPEWSLLPLKSCLEGVIRVLMVGAKKYTRHNWKAGMPWSRVLDATKRHLVAWEEGEDLDNETSLNHIDHALCELLFLRYYITHNVGEDDRFKRPTQPNAPITVTRLLAGFGPQWTNTGVVTSTPTQCVAYNIPAADRLDYIKRMTTPVGDSAQAHQREKMNNLYPEEFWAGLSKGLRDADPDLTHEDIEGDKNYWGV